MKTQTYIVKIEMPDGDKISSTWLKDLIQSDCDVEDSGRQIVFVSEVIEPQGLDEAAKEFARTTFTQPYSETPEKKITIIEPDKLAGFKAGAKWMAEQGFNTTATIISGDEGTLQIHDLDRRKLKQEFSCGDKVVVQIRKK